MKAISPSATATVNALAAEKRRRGERVYNFAAGDPLVAHHPSIVEKAVKSTEKEHFPYPPIEGLPELRKLFAEWVNLTCGTHYRKENVLVTCGGKFALFAILYALLQSGEEVLIHAPYWVSYPEIIKMAGGIPKTIPTTQESDWKITAKDLYHYCGKNTKMLILNNASNPTGALYTKQELQEILNAAKNLGLMVVSDEVYSGLVYDEPGFVSCGEFSEHLERILVVQSCSKSFAMTGWRVGCVLGPENILKRLAALQSQSTTGVSEISQWAAIGALENAEAVNSYVKASMKKRRDLFSQTFNSLYPKPLQPIPSALYAFVPLASLGLLHSNDSSAFCEQMIASANIALVPGTAFGVDGHVRFAFSETESDIVEALHLLKKAIEEVCGGEK